MEKITGTCPGCRKKCDLAAPCCHVGEAFARTGVLPDGKKHKQRKDPTEEAFSTQAQGDTQDGSQKEAPSLDDLLAVKLRAVSRGLRHGEGTLDALTEEENEQLRAILERASAGWAEDHHDHHGHHGHGECGDGHKEKHGHHGREEGKDHKR